MNEGFYFSIINSKGKLIAAFYTKGCYVFQDVIINQK